MPRWSGSVASAQATPGPIPTSPSTPRGPNAPASSGGSALTDSDREILNQLHASNITEIEAGKLALKRARSEPTKRYASEIVKDHEQAERDLNRVATQNKVTLKKPSTEKVSNLNATGGPADFDHEFISMMGREHEAAIKLVKDARESTKNKSLQDLLATVQPVLEKHQQHALQQYHDLPH